MMQHFMGLKIVVSQHATKLTYHWPDKKRSRRLIKKMTKRLGPQVTMEPCAYQMADGRMVVHPSIYAKMRARSETASREAGK